MDLKVRTARASDLPAILKLNKDLFDYETAFNKEYNLDWTYSNSGREYFESVMVDKDKKSFIAEVDNVIVGYIAISIYSKSFRQHNPIAELDNMFVSEASRSNGVGKKLFIEAKKFAKKMGAKRISVNATANNSRAIEFYRSCGFADFDLILEANL